MRVKFGLIFALLHSVWVGGLGYAGNRNHDLQFAWAAQERFDFPVGLLAETARSKLLMGGNLLLSFNAANIWFFLFAGGLQFFVWGYVVGAFSDWAMKSFSPQKRGQQ
jgi:hypothetical protein